MKMKKIITLSAVAFLSTALYANSDMQTQIDALNAKILILEQAQIDELNAKVIELEEKQVKQQKQISAVNKKANNDNIKFDVDFRTAYDNLQYDMTGTGMNMATGQANPKKYKNDNLYSMRLWLGMGYAPTDNMVFKGQLAYHKAFGASNGTRATGHGFDTFDWVINEQLTDDTLKVREAYWLWTPTLASVPMTVSVGRRPATNGYLINLRDDDKAKSPLGHVINMEFDGASVGVKLDSLWSGLNFKVCAGRGLTNAASWASSASAAAGGPGVSQPSYTTIDGDLDNTDMLGFIIKAYDDGQYSLEGTYYRGFDVPGMILSDYSFGADGVAGTADDVKTMGMQTVGDMDGAAISGKIEGIGDEWSDFLDETIIFASYAWTKTRPDSVDRTAMAQGALGMVGMGTGAMFGSDESKTGDSFWIGAQMPNLTGGRFGLEYNQGSEHWRPFTYGEDTFAGSKIATRGKAYEAYWTQPIIDNVFSMQVRYTMMDYDYSGSEGFFGDGGTTIKVSDTAALTQANMNTIDKAQDIRVYFRYRY